MVQTHLPVKTRDIELSLRRFGITQIENSKKLVTKIVDWIHNNPTTADFLTNIKIKFLVRLIKLYKYANKNCWTRNDIYPTRVNTARAVSIFAKQE